ncbi:concanavalin A-like lectin/glucanase domain-containing protein, partial [Epithele typhae]|uniref:concanavalin A-like lectin/glucanase domain-containing protein n=1 Tax=Epithele typhae TaxID=378194 RepID=UPI00200817AB
SAASTSTTRSASPSPGTSTSSSPASTTATSTGSSSTPTSVSGSWKIQQTYQGGSFFDGWTFTSSDDTTTHGTATYVDQPPQYVPSFSAISFFDLMTRAAISNLIEINSDGNAIIRVDTTPTVPGNRQSIKITSTLVLNGGLIILDAVHMPTGCATWPAFWSFGPNWPVGGEIDIVEGVNNYTNNQYTLHTNPGCTLPSSDTGVLGITGTLVDGTDCAAATTGNAGCGIRDSRTNSFGAPFNSNGGGVFVTSWTDEGVSSWFFPRNAIPSDISSGSPNPTGWGEPAASFPASTCTPGTFLFNHNLVFDTTLCGDWAAAVWGATGVPGQDQSCAAITGVADCPTFVHQNGASFSEASSSADWEVKSVKIYQTS